MRCKGTTKAGARCKRSSSEGEEYCVTHADQADSGADATQASATEAEYSDPFGAPNDAGAEPVFEQDIWASVAEVARVGVVIVAAVALGRWLRVL